MIAGIIGIFVAFLIVVLVILFGKKKLEPTISIPLNNFLTSQGFTLVEPTDPTFMKITDACRLTMQPVYIEQVYKRVGDDYVVCWLRNVNGPTNHLVVAIPNPNNSGAWIMLFIPGLKGMSGNIIRKSFELSLPRHFRKMELGPWGQSAIQYDLYVKGGESMPYFKDEFIQLLPQCGNLILRSTGSLMLIERFSLNRAETREQEARELLRITELLRGWL